MNDRHDAPWIHHNYFTVSLATNINLSLLEMVREYNLPNFKRNVYSCLVHYLEICIFSLDQSLTISSELRALCFHSNDHEHTNWLGGLLQLL